MKKTVLIQILALCVATYLLGIFCVPLMDIDAAQYASMSREMLLHGNYLQLFDLGNNYLDKPPMLFWLSSLSLRLFGIHDWAYRLPSFLFALLAIYSTYQLALLYYKQEIALLSAVILASCQALFLINHDVRTDTMLMGWVACSIWQLAAFYQYNKFKNIIWAGVAIAGGMMTKGPLALMIPVFAFAPQFILQRKFNNFLRWQYIPMLLIIAVLLIPMSIGLYQQYDLHPGKRVLNDTINSGLRFFYWTQSFGRITGESTVKEKTSFFFLLQNMLWSFLPWIVFLLLGFVNGVKNIIQQRFYLTDKQEAITLAGFGVTYCALGSSQVQLPHYIFIAFPFAAIITANYLYTLLYTKKLTLYKSPLLIAHAIIFSLLWVILLLLISLPFKTIPLYVTLIAVACFIFFLLLAFTKNLSFSKLLALAFFTIIGINIFLCTAFYPALLQYQTGIIAAEYITDKKIPKEKVYVYGDVTRGGNSLYFYGDYFFKQINNWDALLTGDYMMVSKEAFDKLPKNKACSIIFTGKGVSVTKLTLTFLNPATRDSELIPFYIVLIN